MDARFDGISCACLNLVTCYRLEGQHPSLCQDGNLACVTVIKLSILGQEQSLNDVIKVAAHKGQNRSDGCVLKEIFRCHVSIKMLLILPLMRLTDVYLYLC